MPLSEVVAVFLFGVFYYAYAPEPHMVPYLTSIYIYLFLEYFCRQHGILDPLPSIAEYQRMKEQLETLAKAREEELGKFSKQLADLQKAHEEELSKLSSSHEEEIAEVLRIFEHDVDLFFEMLAKNGISFDDIQEMIRKTAPELPELQIFLGDNLPLTSSSPLPYIDPTIVPLLPFCFIFFLGFIWLFVSYLLSKPQTIPKFETPSLPLRSSSKHPSFEVEKKPGKKLA